MTQRSTARFYVVVIDDVPGFQFEVGWTDGAGESYSIECRDMGEVFDALKEWKWGAADDL